MTTEFHSKEVFPIAEPALFESLLVCARLHPKTVVLRAVYFHDSCLIFASWRLLHSVHDCRATVYATIVVEVTDAANSNGVPNHESWYQLRLDLSTKVSTIGKPLANFSIVSFV